MKVKSFVTSGLVVLLSGFTTTASVASVHSFESGWDGFNNTGTKVFFRRQGATPSSGTGPASGANGSRYYVFLETSFGGAYHKGNTAMLQKSNVSSNTIFFEYHMHGDQTGTLGLEVYFENAWHRVWQASHQQHKNPSTPWTRQQVSLAFYPGRKSIRFVAIAAGGYRGDIAIDNVQFANTSASRTSTFHYDSLNRLVCAEDAVNGDRQYTYDKTGNREQMRIGECHE